MTLKAHHPEFSLYAAMKVFTAQAIPGTLTLLNDKICFKASGVLKGTEIKDNFHFKDIKNIKFGFSFSPFRIVIIDNDGESWIFDQVNRKDAKQFIEIYNSVNKN
ncbi:hypothetical protein ABLV91_07555 [Staphylococcus equorum]|uniref:hypothetical protein n=1 Tax=Staphylococcus TaxID=1279 RepID=UPI0003970542|nr:MULTISPECIES: hypothetical protein [Staphylococcus]ANK36933.1 hypothetical protein AOB58_131 [Staphylococcus sp. AntiMn-1]ANR68469.1 hypothetical protein AWC34_07765 [Staphylococcus equorum]ERH33973.1 hypothetical protein SEQU_12935 [Staphylococcus equorum UMC-CNS-924]MCE5008459.1 hypothetical protein [Staphylococcus equorum]MCE5047710.1 hypothetical protein [Staphylococcus equorum]